MSEEYIKTFAVVDLETNGFPSEQFNRCSITELSVYAFSAKCLKDREDDINLAIVANDIEDGVEPFTIKPPELPRVLHKLTLMINPARLINPSAERVTGLSNDMLCNEAPFDKNTADCLLLFLERLEKPVCLVAHNGWSFDYPVIRHVLEKINMTLPSSIFCVDSFKAFREIDEKQVEIEKTNKVLQVMVHMENEDNEVILNEVAKQQEEVVNEVLLPITSDPLEENTLTDWQKANETTPHRKTNLNKRKFSTLNNDEAKSSSPGSFTPAHKRSVSLSVRRCLFSDNFSPKTKYPKKGVYKLGNIYERIFKEAAENLHRAESDVAVLTKLILHYGLDFLAYAEERKQSFENVPKLGTSTN